MGGRRRKTQQHRHGRRRVHGEGERQEQGCAGDAANAGQNAKCEAAQHAAPEKQQTMRLHNDRKPLRKSV